MLVRCISLFANISTTLKTNFFFFCRHIGCLQTFPTLETTSFVIMLKVKMKPLSPELNLKDKTLAAYTISPYLAAFNMIISQPGIHLVTLYQTKKFWPCPN